MKKKVVSYIFVLLAIGGIMYLTMMRVEDSVELSEVFRSLLTNICGKLGIDISTEWWNTSGNIRLLGHVIEYFVLGLVIGIAVRNKLFGLIICMSFSLIDQIVKIYVPARHFDKGDIPFDIVGFCGGLAIAWVLRFAINKLKDMREQQSELDEIQ